MSKFRDNMILQRDLANISLKEFYNEITNWKNFVSYLYKNLINLNTNKKNKINEKKIKLFEKKQLIKKNKMMNRINKLNSLVETNENGR